MIFYLIGIDYKTVKFEKREEASLLKKNFIKFLESDGMHNARLLSTCNRFEIYDFAKDNDEVSRRLNILKGNFNYLLGDNYAFIGEKEVFKHLLRLGCGLESQVKAESQILEQLVNFSSQKGFPKNLKKIIDKVIFTVRLIRAKAGLDNKIYNIADLVLEDVVEKTNSARLLKIVVIGTGKIAELFASVRKQGVHLYFLAHKNYIKAVELAKKAEGEALLLHKIDEVIFNADVLISATKSPHYVLKGEFFRKIILRRDKPLYIYDLAIPRDIDPAASTINGIVLKNMGDLALIFEKHNQRVKKELAVLENFAQEQVEKYEESFDEENIENRHTAEQVSIKAN